MTDNLAVIVFDVNESLSDMSPIIDRFTNVGAPALMARVWLAGFCGTASPSLRPAPARNS